MVTAKQLPEDRKHGFLVGTDDYMTKPIDEEELLLRIKALLRRARIASERRIEIGNVILDYDTMTVSRGEEEQDAAETMHLSFSFKTASASILDARRLHTLIHPSSLVSES